MPTKLVKLTDGTLVQIDTNLEGAEPICSAAKKVNAVIDDIEPLIMRVCKPVRSVWKELSKEMEIDATEIEIGLGVEAEGNFFIVKGTGNANINIKFSLKPKS